MPFSSVQHPAHSYRRKCPWLVPGRTQGALPFLPSESQCVTSHGGASSSPPCKEHQRIARHPLPPLSLTSSCNHTLGSTSSSPHSHLASIFTVTAPWPPPTHPPRQHRSSRPDHDHLASSHWHEPRAQGLSLDRGRHGLGEPLSCHWHLQRPLLSPNLLQSSTRALSCTS